VRFTVPRSSLPRIDDLVIELDREGQPIAATWRRVGDAAIRRGLPRPSYAHIRRLVLAERRRRAELNDVLGDVVADLAAGRTPGFAYTHDALREARSKRPVEPRVSDTQGSEGEH
jgi:hypothetical protein